MTAKQTVAALAWTVIAIVLFLGSVILYVDVVQAIKYLKGSCEYNARSSSTSYATRH